MTIGILKVQLFIQDSNSLKEKRMVIHSLKAHLRNSFNVAVTQLDDENKWQKAFIVIVGVEKDRKIMNSSISKVINFVENFGKLELIDYEMELI